MKSFSNFGQYFIVLAGFLCYFNADGCSFSVGIIYDAFLAAFGGSIVVTVALPSIMLALPQIVGPIVCPLIDTVGTAWGAIIGGALLFISFFGKSLIILSCL